MKAKNVNNSSTKTKDSIKKAYIELLNNNQDITKIKVSDLIEIANINRSTFYLHYDNIDGVAIDIEEDIIEDIIKDFDFTTVDDYVDKMTAYLKKNEAFYEKLAHSNYYQLFSNKIRDCYEVELEKLISFRYVNVDQSNVGFIANFFIDAIFSQFRNYFLMEDYPYTLDEINKNLKKIIKSYFKI